MPTPIKQRVLRNTSSAPHNNPSSFPSPKPDILFFPMLQYGIVVMGFLDAFVYAHHQHRQSIENPRNFGDCMKGRIRFMTAITPAYAHAYQATCLARHIPAVPHQNFRLPKLKARYPFLPYVRSSTRDTSYLPRASICTLSHHVHLCTCNRP